MIENCCICGGKLSTVKELKFRYVAGMADSYTQHIMMCPKCKFILTGNPFSAEQLANRYKNFSKFEYDSSKCVTVDTDDYKARAIRQKHFIEEHISDFDSVFEVGAASGWNLSLYKESGKKVFGVEPSRANCYGAKSKYGIDMFCGMFDEYRTKRQNVGGGDRI